MIKDPVGNSTESKSFQEIFELYGSKSEQTIIIIQIDKTST